jgi:hypothetical protein
MRIMAIRGARVSKEEERSTMWLIFSNYHRKTVK